MDAMRIDVRDWRDEEEHYEFTKKMQLVDSIGELWVQFPYMTLGEVIARAKYLGVYDWLILGDKGPIGVVT